MGFRGNTQRNLGRIDNWGWEATLNSRLYESDAVGLSVDLTASHVDNEIKSLKGGRFNILVFIGVIIVALIREILISTLRHDELTTQIFLAGTLLILGVVYFLIAKSQQFKAV